MRWSMSLSLERRAFMGLTFGVLVCKQRVMGGDGDGDGDVGGDGWY